MRTDTDLATVDGAAQSLGASALRLAMPVSIRRGTGLAWWGEVSFEHVDMPKHHRRLDESVHVVRASGDGEVVVAYDGRHLRRLELGAGEAVHVSGGHLVAFTGADPTVATLEGTAGLILGHYSFVGPATVVVASRGEPVELHPEGRKLSVATAGAMAWSADLHVSVQSESTLKALLGRGSGELFQYVFEGDGFVLAEPIEHN